MDPHRRHFGATAPAANSQSYLPPQPQHLSHQQPPSNTPPASHPAQNPSLYHPHHHQQPQQQQAPPPQPPHSATRRENDRDRPFASAPSAPKRIKMNGRTPSRDQEFYSPYPHPQTQQPPHAQHQQQQPAPSSHSPPGPSAQHGGIPPLHRYGEPRSPDHERTSGPGSGYRGPPPPLQHDPMQHQQSSINPAANRGSPAFLPPHRTSTPESHHGHRRTPSYNSPQVARGPQQDSSSMSQPPQPLSLQGQQHQQHHPQMRGMPPPSSPHRHAHSHSHSHSQSGPLRPPPPPMHPGYNAQPPRELPSLSSLPVTRASMSIFSMLDSAPPMQSPQTTSASPVSSTHALPPPNLIASRPHELSPLKGPFTPDFGPDRPRDIGSTSASPSSGKASLPGLQGPPKIGHGTPDPVYRAHQQLQHHSNAPQLDRDPSLGTPMYGQQRPPRPLSQPVHPTRAMEGMHQEMQNARHARSESVSERERQYERDQQRYYREREREMREMQDREYKKQQEVRERQRVQQQEQQQHQQELERERELEQERAREREKREREREHDRQKPREHYGQQEQFDGPAPGTTMFGREPMEMQNAQAGRPGFLSGPSRFGSNGIPTTQPLAQPTSSSMSMPQGSTSAPGLPSIPAPLPSATREGFAPFSGYSLAMPSSPFAIQPGLPALPTIGNDARDRDGRPQRNKIREQGPPAPGREEPLRAEDALQRGLNRSLSSYIEDDKRRNVGKDRDGIIKDKDGIMRLTDSAVPYQSPPRRSIGSGFTTGGREWGELPPIEKDKDGKEKTGLGIGIVGKRDREDDDSTKSEKKKRHHHHHQHIPHHHVPHPHHHHYHHHEEPPSMLEAPTNPASRARSPLHLHNRHPHHHTHTHHAPPPYRPAPPPGALSKLTTTLIIDSSKVLASLTTKPRNYLGCIVYLPRPVPREGMSVTAPLIPRFEGRENSIFQVRIPKRFLSLPQRTETAKRRHIWGSEVYTDDSDVLTVLMHTGRIPTGADPNLLNTSSRKLILQGSVTSTPVVPASKWGAPSPPKEDPPELKPGMDLLVNLVILPTLERYSGTTRFGIKSRSWKTQHDGMSYSIWDLQWVPAGEAESRGPGSRKRRLDEREHVRRWGELPRSLGGQGGEGWGKGRWLGKVGA